MNLGQYRDIFGKPDEGVHKYRTLGLATVDIVGTFVMAAAISKYSKYSFCAVLLFLLVLATFLHWFFCVETAGLRLLELGTACGTVNSH